MLRLWSKNGRGRLSSALTYQEMSQIGVLNLRATPGGQCRHPCFQGAPEAQGVLGTELGLLSPSLLPFDEAVDNVSILWSPRPPRAPGSRLGAIFAGHLKKPQPPPPKEQHIPLPKCFCTTCKSKIVRLPVVHRSVSCCPRFSDFLLVG